MKGSQKLLLAAGLALTFTAMIYGFYYAVVDEHPTLNRMGYSLASAFAHVASGETEQARESLETYGETRFEYIREVHSHGHLAALSTVLLLLGLFFNQLSFSERSRVYLASSLVFGTVALPLGSLLETFIAGPVPQALSVLGSVALIAGLGVVAVGFLLPAKR